MGGVASQLCISQEPRAYLMYLACVLSVLQAWVIVLLGNKLPYLWNYALG